MADQAGIAVVTGGSSGIGEATAHRLARDLPSARLQGIASTIGLEAVPKAAERLLAGEVKGRLVVDPTA